MRVDAAKHIAKPFWTQFQKSLDSIDVFTAGEVLSDNAAYTCNYMSDALSSVLNYPMFVASPTTVRTQD
jgi:alpha-amylase